VPDVPADESDEEDKGGEREDEFVHGRSRTRWSGLVPS
jgi:hypothetical protein